ncbi:hypothetical protein IPU70_23025 [Achromobacter sp. SD115]|nr:hypothetical protein [Achromobacter sp. SD115]MBO1016449.1 hypothetical protein [Achromobacter sp. SD115]
MTKWFDTNYQYIVPGLTTATEYWNWACPA